MNLPNALTLSRLVAIPVLMVLLAVSFPFHDQIAAVIFVLASLTDTLDGNLARSRHQVSELGKFLDPLADKLFVLSVLIALVQVQVVPAWVVVIMFSRELLITVLRSLRANQGVVAATPFGKTKTVIQIVAVVLLILVRPYPVLQIPAWIVIGIALLFTVASGIDYLWRFRAIWFGGRAAEEAQKTGALRPDTESESLPLAQTLADQLQRAGATIGTAESCTGGLLAGALTDLPGSSAYFRGAVVAYANDAKRERLGVPEDLLRTKGAVSAEVAQAMAEGARAALHTDYAISTTGISGPSADGTTKPVGLTHIWVAGPARGAGRRFVFPGDRSQNRGQAVIEALRLAVEQTARLDTANTRS
ncbi:MAG: CDP-diacylglycerol--glycerol-3-phosphate 3-phosphatidyltransferase [Candidatus Dormibacteraeota bacterium]|nr:CDP-diacylglycerol--glycerol-3-phosphate 3-phosphatidyltransferase [Candidatus Dormibacteraeota bacterium]